MKKISLLICLFCLSFYSLNAQILTLDFSTFIGGSLDDRIHGMAVDAANQIYITAPIRSTDFPVTEQAVQKSATGIYVAKMKAGGDSLLMSTFIGVPGGANYAHSVAVDEAGCIYIAGNTTNENFPTTQGAFDRTFHGPADASHGDAFVMKLSPDGSDIIYSTFIGGSDMDISDKIAVDNEGNVVFTGTTSSQDFPVTDDAFDTEFNGGGNYGRGDVFVAKLNADGSDLIFCSYLGGSNTEPGAGLKIGQNGDVYLFGTTSSSDFPTSENAYCSNYKGGSGELGVGDGFFAQLSADGSTLLYSTFLGGTADDNICSVSFDAQGNIYLAGKTNSTDLHTTADAMQPTLAGGNDGFIMKCSPDMRSVLYSTFLGGTKDESSFTLCCFADLLVISGETESDDFLVTDNALDTSFNGNSDRFITLIDPATHEIVYSTYWGGSGFEGGAMCMNESGLFLAGTTTSRDLPVSDNVYDNSYNGGGAMRWGGDGYVAGFSLRNSE